MADTKWFSDAKFGMFVHFGLYSIPAGVWKGKKMGRNWYAEWIQVQGDWPKGIPAGEYQSLAGSFNPDKFNAEEWILEAKNAGMKYFLITSKHHDGFALWHSKASKFNVVDATPFKRDILRELVDACHKHSIVPGFYYSHWLDWEHPGGANPHWPELPDDPDYSQPSQEEFEEYWQEKCLPQIAELITEYNARFLWFDSWQESPLLTEKRIDELIALIRRLNPEVLINSRIGTTWNHSKKDDIVDYISMSDNVFPDKLIERPWETSATFNRSWGYHLLDFKWRPAKDLIKHLVDNTSRNGNFQLNIGPMPDGRFPPPSIRRLREVGAWLSVNGDCIYRTTPSPYKEPSWGRLTLKGTRLYAVVYENDPAATLTIEGIKKKPKEAVILETGQSVKFDLQDNCLILQLPEESSLTELNVVSISL